MKIVFIGDIVGKRARETLIDKIPIIKTKYTTDVIVVNAENAAAGYGLSKKIAMQLIEAGVDAITLGNHDLHLIAVANGILEPSKNDTIGQILKNQDRDLYIEWLKNIPLLHKSTILTEAEERTFVMTHAGIPPHWSLNNAIKFSEEISSVLRSKTNCIPFLKTMYGDYPDQYNKDLKTEERLRLNTNYLTRMRFCNQEGKLEFKHKGESNKPPEGYKPWFDNDLRIMQEPVHLLFGHWAALNGETGIENISALDTGCVWGGKLTAFNLEEGRVFSCNRLN